MRRSSKRHYAPVTTAAPSSHLGCSGKKQYLSFTDANRVSVLVRKNKDGEHPSAYRCKHCQSFHIGSKSQTKRRPKLDF